MYYYLFCFLFVLPPGTTESSQPVSETITVTATRSETPLSQVGSAITVITAEEIRRSGHTHVAELLRDVPGLDLVQTGGPGRATSAFIRGAASGHTLVLVDGVEMNDPISAGNAFNLAHVTVDAIERIEIVRGPQSTLYGSDAMGGVIHIITRNNGERHLGLNLSAGSYGVRQGGVDFEGATSVLNYTISGSQYESDGFSAAREDLGNSEEDGYENTTLAANVSAQTQSWTLGLNARFTHADADIDNSGGIGGDDPNYVSGVNQIFTRLYADFTGDDRWRHQIGVAYTDNERDLSNGLDSDHPESSVDANYNGEKLKIDWRHNLTIANIDLTFGVETEEEKGNSLYSSTSSFGPYVDEYLPQTARTSGLYLQNQMRLGKRASITLGGRYDDHDRFGDKVTWRGVTSVRLNESGTSLKGSVGTGFKAPSLFQLFSSFGDEDLSAEESTGWDAGISHFAPSGVFSLSAVYFANDFENLIDFDSNTFTYQNIAESKTSGVEFSGTWRANDAFSARLDLTLMDTEDGATGERLYRRPDQKASLQFNYRFTDRGQLQLNIRHIGERDFQDFSNFPATRLILDDFTLFHLSGSWKLLERLEFTLRLENLTDEDYQEVLGYGTAGSSGYLGLRFDY